MGFFGASVGHSQHAGDRNQESQGERFDDLCVSRICEHAGKGKGGKGTGVETISVDFSGETFGKIGVGDVILMGENEEGQVVEIDGKRCVVHMKHGRGGAW